jgi:nucleotide-binding universal stress UspA family protein
LVQGLLKALSIAFSERHMRYQILVPTDFSPPSDAALSYARLLARTFDASLYLLHVTGAHMRSPRTAMNSRNRVPPALRELRDRLTADDRPPDVAILAVEAADPAGQIVRTARSMDASLIVMGTHGRGGIARVLMGSVAEKVVRTAPCPVFTTNAALRAPARGVRRILAPTDFSAASDAALDCARRLAAGFGASMHLLHVLPDVSASDGAGSELFVTEAPEARSMRLIDARDRLQHRITADDRATLRATSEVIFGSPAQIIVDYAADNQFDLIVMGTHGRTGMAHLLIGSVAERVVRTAGCPVLTTQHAWERAADMVKQEDVAEAIC